MSDVEAKELQRPVELDPSYITELIKARLDLLKYKEPRPNYYLYTDLAIIYNTSVCLVQRINTLIESPVEDLDTLSRAVSDIRVALGPSLRHYIRTSARSLHHLQKHILELEAQTED